MRLIVKDVGARLNLYIIRTLLLFSRRVEDVALQTKTTAPLIGQTLPKATSAASVRCIWKLLR